jgi:anti-sigma factor RsiW
MNVDDTLLLAYVDGELSQDLKTEVELTVAQSSELAERLAAMRASVLPYAAAYERQALPPVPQALSQRVAELASVSANSRLPLPRKSLWPPLAAAFVAGVVCCAVLLRFSLGPMATVTASTVSPWIKAVAEYQDLYSRETLADVVEDHSLTQKVIGDLHRTSGMSVRVPDLRDSGLTFKRVQRLSYHDRAVAQIVYLPDRGTPVALCVTQEAGIDEPPRAEQVGDMKAVAWRHDGLGYVLLGKDPHLNLSALARHIAEGDVTALYSWLAGTRAQDAHS